MYTVMTSTKSPEKAEHFAGHVPLHEVSSRSLSNQYRLLLVTVGPYITNLVICKDDLDHAPSCFFELCTYTVIDRATHDEPA